MTLPEPAVRISPILRRWAPLALAGGLLLLTLFTACQPESTTPFETNNAPDFREFNLAYYDTASGEFVAVVPQMGVIDTLPAVDTFYAHAAAHDVEGDSLRFQWWNQPAGVGIEFENSDQADTRWFYSGTLDSVVIGVTVSDDYDETSMSDTLAIKRRNADGSNIPPEIESLSTSLSDNETEVNQDVQLIVVADDPDGWPGELQIEWSADSGTFSSTSNDTTVWTAPDTPDLVDIVVTVTDGADTVADLVSIAVVDPDNMPPEIVSFGTNQGSDPVYPGDTLQVLVIANDPDGVNENLTYDWFASAGEYVEGEANFRTWVAPAEPQQVTLSVEVSDEVNTVLGSQNVDVVIPPFMLDFSTDQVTDRWTYGGLLAGMGELINSHQISWDGNREALAMMGFAYWAHPVYYLENELFGNVTMEITCWLPNPDDPNYQFVGFVPKFRNAANYFAVGIDFFHGGTAVVLRGVDGVVSYLYSGGDYLFEANTPHTLKYQRTDTVTKVWIDDTLIWQGNNVPELDLNTVVGVCVSNGQGAEAALFDDLIITDNE